MNHEKIELKLYIIEKSPAYLETVNKLYGLLESRFNDLFNLVVIDILKNPEMTLADEILASPTLIRVWPLPSRRIVGSLLEKNLVEELDLLSLKNDQ